jgi:hypothetical protein
MYKQLELYKNLSMELLDLLKRDEFDEIDKILDKRNSVIEELDKKQRTKFKKLYIESNTHDIDKEIKNIFEKKIVNIKYEIKTQKKVRQANYSYIKIKQENLNIFNKKV